jgi:hypothetical protein
MIASSAHVYNGVQFRDVDEWLDACPVPLNEATKAGIAAMVSASAEKADCQ